MIAIIVMGVSGAGKTTVARRLAQRLECPFLEGDDFHSRANVAKMSDGQGLTDQDRWPWLDAVADELAAQLGASDCCVATCSALRRSYRDRLRTRLATELPDAEVRFVLLDADRETLIERVHSRRNHYMPASLLDSQLETLEVPGPDENAILASANSSPLRIVERLIEVLGLRIDGRR